MMMAVSKTEWTRPCKSCGKRERLVHKQLVGRWKSVGYPDGWLSLPYVTKHGKVRDITVCSLPCAKDYEKKHGL